MSPNILVCSASVALWSWLVFLFFLLWLGCLLSKILCYRFRFLYFWLLLLFFQLSLLFLFLLFLLFLFFSLLFFLLLLFLLNFLLGLEFLKVGFAGVDNDLFSFFLISEKISMPSKKSKDRVKKSIDITLLLNNGH